jgi:putative transposase
MPHTYTSLLVHLVFSTKHRMPLLTPPVRERLFPYMGGIIRKLNGKALIIGGMLDHGHILASFPTTIALADAMREIKADSSGWTRAEGLCVPFGWQTGYGAFSIGRSERDTVYHYIENQESHHRTVTYQDEFLTLLNYYDVEYDPRYLWD